MRRVVCVVSVCAVFGTAACDRPNVLFPKFERDQITAIGVMSTVGELVDASLDDMPLGEVDMEATCPGGGSGHITGTLDAADGSSLELTIELDGCSATQALAGGMVSASLTLDGTFRLQRDLAPLTGWGTEEYISDQLELEGTISSYGEEASIDSSRLFEMKIVSTEISGAVVGKLGKRPVSWSYRHTACTAD